MASQEESLSQKTRNRRKGVSKGNDKDTEITDLASESATPPMATIDPQELQAALIKAFANKEVAETIGNFINPTISKHLAPLLGMHTGTRYYRNIGSNMDRLMVSKWCSIVFRYFMTRHPHLKSEIRLKT